MQFIATKERYVKMGQPDLNSIIYLLDRKKSKKVYFQVVGIQFGHKKGIKLSLTRK